MQLHVKMHIFLAFENITQSLVFGGAGGVSFSGETAYLQRGHLTGLKLWLDSSDEGYDSVI
jgi:hypothetical protein